MDGQTMGDGQTIGQLTSEFVDGQTISQLTGEFVDEQTDNLVVRSSSHRSCSCLTLTIDLDLDLDDDDDKYGEPDADGRRDGMSKLPTVKAKLYL